MQAKESISTEPQYRIKQYLDEISHLQLIQMTDSYNITHTYYEKVWVYNMENKHVYI